jgi:hypothetical protein
MRHDLINVASHRAQRLGGHRPRGCVACMPDRPSSDVPEDGRDHGPLSSGPAPSPYDAKQLKSVLAP